MIGVMLKSHFASHQLVGVLGPGDFRSDETLERRFGELGHSKNPRTFSGIPQEPWQVQFLVARRISGNLEIPKISL